jgi:signal transduction histidine kinase
MKVMYARTAQEGTGSVGGRAAMSRVLGSVRSSLPRSRPRSLAFDALIALFVLSLGLAQLRHELGNGRSGSLALDVVLLVSVSLPLMWRREYPISVLAIVTVANLSWFLIPRLSDLALMDFNSGFIAFLVALYSAGLYAPSRKTSCVAAAVALAGVLTALASSGEFGSIGEFVPNAVVVAVFWYIGYTEQTRREQLEQRAALLQREQEEESRRAGAAERVRIARELHDVVAHSVGLMTVQAGAANHVAANDPRAAISSLASIERTGRQALGELRRLLEVLRTEADSRAALHPQPGLGQLDEVVAEVQKAGLSVGVTVEGDLDGLPPALDLSAYRIVQEALTNVGKHAGPWARAEVKVKRTENELILDISDDGRGVDLNIEVAGGHGLIGMRERVALFGGRISAGPRRGGGFSVRVEIPVDAGPS